METYDAHKTTTEVRQGSKRLMNFRVLILSIIGIVVLFAILFFVSTMQQPGGEGSVIDPNAAPAAAPATPMQDPATTPTPTN